MQLSKIYTTNVSKYYLCIYFILHIIFPYYNIYIIIQNRDECLKSGHPINIREFQQPTKKGQPERASKVRHARGNARMHTLSPPGRRRRSTISNART